MHPTASQATEARVERRTLSVSLKELAFCRRLASGTRQLSIVINAFWTTRKAILFSIFSAVKPGVPFSTTKALTWLSETSPTRLSWKWYTTQHEKGLFQKRCAT